MHPTDSSTDHDGTSRHCAGLSRTVAQRGQRRPFPARDRPLGSPLDRVPRSPPNFCDIEASRNNCSIQRILRSEWFVGNSEVVDVTSTSSGLFADVVRQVTNKTPQLR
ncbi:hypothetical protein PUN28_011426 [Cardiocondyla obscurior]|uniref:Uncharacterized protein n=1 Tax=Cardiocondyla obscurior TaxID=286306 RepID=A0AAW2FGG0_9HYME